MDCLLQRVVDALPGFYPIRRCAKHDARGGIADVGQDMYARKHCAEFTRELNRSVAVWLQRRETPER